MKKILYVAVSLLLILTLTSCDLEQIDDALFESKDATLDISDENKELSSETEKSKSTTNNKNKETTKQTNKATTKATNEEATKKTDKESNNNAELEKVNNGVLKEASTDTMNVPANMRLLKTSDATEENNAENIKATVVLYTLDGDVVNWLTENDLIYVITAGNNRLVLIDTKSMTPLSNVPLAGKPAEINIVGDDIYISLPNLCRIDIFSKNDLQKKSSLYFDHEVSSFCLDGDYIYYTEHDQFCDVFKKNINTNEITPIGSNFYYPKVYLNKEDKILYIGESGSSGSAIYYYDTDTLTQKSFFKKNNYGITNHTREIFHIDDKIFWGNYCLSDTNAKELIGMYGTASYGSVVFASTELVSTYEGLFLTDTYECIINYFDAGFKFEYILVSDSYNIFFRQRTFDRNIIVGINFELQ